MEALNNKLKMKQMNKQQEMVQVASMMAGKLVSESISEEAQAKLIEETCNEMGDSTWQS